MEEWEESVIMAQAALGVKNRVIDALSGEVQALRKENQTLFRTVVKGPGLSLPAQQQQQAVAPDGTTSTAEQHSTAAASSCDQLQQVHVEGPTVTVQQPAATTAEAEAAALRLQLQEAHAKQQQSEARMLELSAELDATRQHIGALEAELQDTMDAAMQLWETVQLGTCSEGTPSRPGSAYQEQLSLCDAFTADGEDEEEGGPSSWRTPSASPAPADSVSPRSAAAAAASGGDSSSGARLDRQTLAGLAAASSSGCSGGIIRLSSSSAAGSLPHVLSSSRPGSSSGSHMMMSAGGFFTPIEARVNSITNKLRDIMHRQPSLSQSEHSLQLAGAQSSPATKAGESPRPAAAFSTAGVGTAGADVRATRDVGETGRCNVESS